MNPNSKTIKRTAKPKPRLRQWQKALTRQRILDAARQVFYDSGYTGATVDQIVEVAGAGRQTFYSHFSDKEQVLAQLVSDYNAGGAVVMGRLPGPMPTLAQLRSWLLEFAEFLEKEKAAYSVLAQVSYHPKTHEAYGRPTAELWVSALARRAPAFAAALKSGSVGIRARARAWRLIVDITWAAAVAWERRGTEFAEEVITDVTESLLAFLHDPPLQEATQSKTKRHQ
jgi:AcrR family transcriptional regulator